VFRACEASGGTARMIPRAPTPNPDGGVPQEGWRVEGVACTIDGMSPRRQNAGTRRGELGCLSLRWMMCWRWPRASTGPARPGIMRTCELAAGVPGFYVKMLTARAITSTPMPRDTTASIIISSLAHRLIAEMSVGLNAVAVQKASDR
jgi:type II secretory pathway component PulM